jgi:Fe2+ or Zn2+ uptake regulation protein
MLINIVYEKTSWFSRKEEFMKITKNHHHQTAQRAAILQYLKNNIHHPNIIDIYNNVSKKLSTISMTTIYNTIDFLEKEGLIHEVAVRHHEGRRYDSNLTPHDHLICDICGNVVNVEVDIDHDVLLTEKQKQGFDIREARIIFYGLCPVCRDRTNESNIN